MLIQLLDKQIGYMTFIKRFYKNRIPDETSKDIKKIASSIDTPEVVID